MAVVVTEAPLDEVRAAVAAHDFSFEVEPTEVQYPAGRGQLYEVVLANGTEPRPDIARTLRGGAKQPLAWDDRLRSGLGRELLDQRRAVKPWALCRSQLRHVTFSNASFLNELRYGHRVDVNGPADLYELPG